MSKENVLKTETAMNALPGRKRLFLNQNPSCPPSAPLPSQKKEVNSRTPGFMSHLIFVI